MTLLSVDADAKTTKGHALGILTGILYLAPSDEAMVINTCPNATKGCRLSCLFSAGRGAFDEIKYARIAKTMWFVKDKDSFMKKLAKDIFDLVRKALALGLRPAVRLNGTSDLAWENIKNSDGKTIFDLVGSDITFYDYTKSESRMFDYLDNKLPVNYHLTFSRSENNDGNAVLQRGGNVAVVFSGELPATYLNKFVINGDVTDARFLDPKTVVVGLRAKGKATKDETGFVVKV